MDNVNTNKWNAECGVSYDYFNKRRSMMSEGGWHYWYKYLTVGGSIVDLFKSSLLMATVQ